MNLEKILSHFPEQTLLVLGDVFIDEYLTGDCSRLSPEAPVPILKVQAALKVLGGAANTAANIASLGGKVLLMGLLGEDDNGREFLQLAKNLGIQTIPIHDGRPTIKKTRLVGARQQLLRLDYEETHTINESTEARIFEMFSQQLPLASMVVVSDYAKGFFTQDLVKKIIAAVHVQNKQVIIDPRPQHFHFYKNADYLTPNWKESQGLLGQIESSATTDKIIANGDALRKELNSSILLTLGPKGISFFPKQKENNFNVPTVAKEVFDVSGAGDTVVAAFALAKASGCKDQEAVLIANQAAGVVVGKLGTATLTRDELLHYTSAHKRLLTRDELSPWSKTQKANEKKIVTLNGSFDLLHAGHLHILEEAKRQGDVLLVGINSDASVKRYKGESRPLIPEQYRAQMLLALRAVDFVHIFDEDVPMPFLAEVQPTVHVNGSEYGEQCIEAETVKKFGGNIHIVEKIPGLSTSQIIAAIVAQP